MFASKMESSHCPLRIYDFFMIFGNHLLPQIRLKREEEENSRKKNLDAKTVGDRCQGQATVAHLLGSRMVFL